MLDVHQKKKNCFYLRWRIYLTLNSLHMFKRARPLLDCAGTTALQPQWQSSPNSKPTNRPKAPEGAAASPSRDESWQKRTFKSGDLDAIGGQPNVSFPCSRPRINALPLLRKSERFSWRQVGHSRDPRSSNFIHGDRSTLIRKAAKSKDKDIWQGGGGLLRLQGSVPKNIQAIHTRVRTV